MSLTDTRNKLRVKKKIFKAIWTKFKNQMTKYLSILQIRKIQKQSTNRVYNKLLDQINKSANFKIKLNKCKRN